MIDVDEKHRKLAIKLGSFAEIESSELYRNFVEGRHQAVLLRLLDEQYLRLLRQDREYLIIAIDEADKCPVPVARLIRSMTTRKQHRGIKGIRFLLAGVAPFYQQMLDEDAGLARFIYRTITLSPIETDDATQLMETKLGLVTEDARKKRIRVTIDTGIIERVVALSGGHPLLLQLLGSYLVDNENDNPDGIIDAQDLLTALRRICYEDRAQVYDSTLHKLEAESQMQNLRRLLALAGSGFPTRIKRANAMHALKPNELQWFVDRNILSVVLDRHYGLDEFLRVRVLLDQEETDEARAQIEQSLLGTC